MQEWALASPDGNATITFMVKEVEGARTAIFYKVGYIGNAIVDDSALGLALQNDTPFHYNLAVESVDTSTQYNEWSPVYGERSLITDHYAEMKVTLKETSAPGRKLQITFRAYNEGVALQYYIPAQDRLRSFVIENELTQFAFAADSTIYAEYWPEDEYHPIRVRELEKPTERPLTVECTNRTYVCLHEAAMNDYSKMMLIRDAAQPDVLSASIVGPVSGQAPFRSPWRLFILGDRPGQLLERNDIVLNLNAPCELDSTSWIRPGTVIRETTLTTTGGKSCVDFAKARRIPYIEFDAGWYGSEVDDRSDASFVSVDPDRKGRGWDGLDLSEVIDYANKHGVGVWLYVNRRALERQLDEILPIYRQWGVKGIKFGFVNEGPQAWTTWLLEAVRKCAQYELMVDIHDFYRPTGYSRTYPNLLTVEGIRGNEHFPTATHNCTLPFTRFPGGPGDYTICYYTDRLKNSRTHQMAMSVIVYSPLQFIFWYDRPSDYKQEPEIAFFERLHTVWDDTKVLLGRIGQYVSIARRKGDDWFIGTITNEDERTLEIPLSFLPDGRCFTAHIYEDDCGADADQRKVRIRTIEVHSKTVLQAQTRPCGGQAVHIVPS